MTLFASKVELEYEDWNNPGSYCYEEFVFGVSDTLNGAKKLISEYKNKLIEPYYYKDRIHEADNILTCSGCSYEFTIEQINLNTIFRGP